MYDCLECGCKYPKHYDKCPVCGSEKRRKERFKEFAQQEEEEIKFSPFVEMSESEDME